jgi:hypothetical protein
MAFIPKDGDVRQWKILAGGRIIASYFSFFQFFAAFCCSFLIFLSPGYNSSGERMRSYRMMSPREDFQQCVANFFFLSCFSLDYLILLSILSKNLGNVRMIKSRKNSV